MSDLDHASMTPEQQAGETTAEPVESELAGMFIADNLKSGGDVEIPSLGITLRGEPVTDPDTITRWTKLGEVVEYLLEGFTWVKIYRMGEFVVGERKYRDGEETPRDAGQNT